MKEKSMKASYYFTSFPSGKKRTKREVITEEIEWVEI